MQEVASAVKNQMRLLSSGPWFISPPSGIGGGGGGAVVAMVV
jgi:hypothetical protein